MDSAQTTDPPRIVITFGAYGIAIDGFDAPFDLLVGVARHMRSVAAEAARVGRETVRPDPETLRQIAQRAHGGSVVAELQETGLVLRPRRASDGPPIPLAPPVPTRAAPARGDTDDPLLLRPDQRVDAMR